MALLDPFATEPIVQFWLHLRDTPEWFDLQERMIQIEEELLLEEADEDRYYAESSASAYRGWNSLD